MDLVLISTSNVSAGRSEALDRMLMTVARTASSRPDISINVMLLLQEAPADLGCAHSFPEFVATASIPYQTSLSAARNILLSQAFSRGLIRPGTVVGFPDDDCWYPQGTLEYIVDQFSHTPGLDLWFCRYSADPVSTAEVEVAPKPARARDVIRDASSNTMFVRGRVIEAGVSFDEKLGVGTPIGGAEDTEFALYAHILGTQTMRLDAAVVGHRDKSPQLRVRYYQGGLIAIAKHVHKHQGVSIELMRKIGVGGWLVLRRELSLAGFVDALSAAFSAWRTAN